MQQKNLLQFVLMSILVFTVWSMVENMIWPRKPRKVGAPAPAAVEDKRTLDCDPMLWAELSASALAADAPGAGHLGSLGLAVGVAEEQKRNRRKAAFELVREKADKRKQAAAVTAAKHEEVALGGSEFNLGVVLTSRGAGVQSLTLNKFKSANSMGRPQEGPLQLIPAGGKHDDPSNALYHYGAVEDSHPLDTLGGFEWTLDSKQVDDNGPHQAVFSAPVPGKDLRLIKTFTLGKGDYHLGLTVEIQRPEGVGKDPEKFRYQLTSGHGLPIEGVWYTSIFRNAQVGSVDAGGHLWRDFQDSGTIGTQSGGTEVRKTEGKFIQFAGISVQYFASMIVVDDRQPKKDFLAWARPTVEGDQHRERPYLDDIQMRVVSEPIELKPGEKVTHKYLLYNGPVKVRQLGELTGDKAVSPELVQRYTDTLHLRSMQDFGSWGVWTDLILFFTNRMHDVLGFLHKIVPNYGLCIILLTVMVRGMMFPISRKQAQTSVKMQALAPELKKLQEKYKGDRQAMGMAQMELYKKHGVHPLGSCWILFLQMPIFMGLYYSLQESIHLRLAPFLYIQNLAAPDMLIYWGQNIPIISRPEDMGGIFYLGPYFNLLPIIAVVLMIVQQKLNTPPAMDPEQEMQQRMMKYMSAFFGLLFYKVAAGLCLYFTISSLWGLAERKMLPKAGKGPHAVAAKKPSPHAPKSSNGSTGYGKKLKGWWEDVLREAKKK